MYTPALVSHTEKGEGRAQRCMLSRQTDKVSERHSDQKASERSGLISNNEVYNMLCVWTND